MPLKNKEARAAYMKRWRTTNAGSERPKAVRRAKATRKRLLLFVQSLKTGPCVDCGVSYPPYVMDFDHIGDDKILGIAEARLSWSKRHLLEEIAKCELVCANCHRERTHQRIWTHNSTAECRVYTPEAVGSNPSASTKPNR